MVAVVHFGTAAAWLGAMLYSLFVPAARGGVPLGRGGPRDFADRSRVGSRAKRRFALVAIGLTATVGAGLVLGVVADALAE